MSAFKKSNKRKGFTVTELVIVVAIIAILLAVAVPNIIAYYRELRLVELDDSARTIFLAAQNRLSAMIIANKKDIPTGKPGWCNYTGTTDPGITTTKGKVDFDYLTSQDAELSAIVLPGSIESGLHDNNYIVEYDPDSGVVHAVWYWEGEFDRFGNAYTGNYTYVNDAAKSSRKDYPVGYYGGGNVDRAKVGQMTIPDLTLINAEELRLEIKIPKINITGVTGLSDKIRVNVAINGKNIVEGAKLLDDTGVGTVVLDTLKNSYPKAWDGVTSNTSSAWTVGNKFKDWVTKAGLGATPGDDITVSVTVYMSEAVGADKLLLLPQTASVKTNSLFEKVEGDTAYIAYGRHLQNLHESGSNGPYCSGVENITSAVQTKDINFWLSNSANPIQSWHDTYGPDMNFHPISNGNITAYNGSYNGQRYEIRNITAAEGDNGFDGLFSFAMSMSLENITMVNPTVLCDENAGSAGALVAFASGVKISGCQVYNEYIDGKGDPDSVKELLELADTDKLDNITVTVVTDSLTGEKHQHVPQLEGLPHIGAPDAGSSAGGLVGNASDTIDISNSFASVIVIGEGYAGGLVGNFCSNFGSGKLSINKSYSGSYVYFNHHGAGLVGRVDPNDSNLSITDSYAAGEVVSGFDHNTAVGAGLFTFPDARGVKFESFEVINCYSAVRFGGELINYNRFLTSFNKNTERYPAGKTTINNVFYVKQSGYNDKGFDAFGNGVASAGDAVTTAELTAKINDTTFSDTVWNTGTGVTNSLTNTHPYRLLTETKDLGKTAYPYPMLKNGGAVVPQYGDWLEADDAQAAFVYFEKYVGGEYGFEGYNCVAGGTPEPFNKQPLETKQPSDDFYAVSDGYGVLVQRADKDTDTTPPTNVKVGGTEVTFDDPADVIRNVLTVTEGTGEIFYDLYIIKNQTATPGTYYKTVSIGDDVEYYFNPDFAREVIAAEAMPAGPQSRDPESGDISTSGSANGVVIRTARQLANMSKYTNDTSAAAQKWSFIQTLNVDFMGYDLDDLPGKIKRKDYEAAGTLPNYTEFEGVTPFVPAKLATDGSYTGNEYNIRYLYLYNDGSNPNQGLFGVVDGGTLSGIRLLNVKAYTGDNTGRSGALVGYLKSGIVENCGVYVENKHENTKYTNYNRVDVVINQHYYRLFAVATNTKDAGVGGLIGEMDGGNVSNSFASVKVYAKEGYAGGFAGKINGGTITDCYSGGKTLGGVYRGISEASGTDSSNIGTNSGYAGGFAGSIGSGAKFEGINYSTCSVRGNNDTLGQIGMFAGGTEDAHSFDGSIAYATGTAFKNIDSPTTNADGSQERYTPVYYSQIHDETDYLLVGNTAPYGDATQGTKLEAANTFPYDLAALRGQAFPFATNNKEHHGDWIQAAMFAYIEIYDDDTYGVYSAKAGSTSNEAIINTLDSDNVVKSDFYRILNLGDISGKKFEINDVEDATGLKRDTKTYNVLGEAGKLEVEGKVYDVFEFAAIDPANNTAPSEYYNKLEIGNNTYYYNLYFACEAFEATAGTVPPTGQFAKPEAAGQGTAESYPGVVIRSARQLVYMSKYTTGWKQGAANTIYDQARAWNYDQLLDIDYGTYVNEYNGVGADSENGGTAVYNGGYTNGERQRPAILTTGSYNGHDKYIKNLYIGADVSNVSSDTQLGSGLFGSVSGSVSNVNLINVSVDGGSSSLATGGLVGVLQTSGVVDTCGIYVEDFKTNYGTLTVTGKSGNGVGGLIGQINGGSVSASFAAVKVEGTAATGTPILTNPVGGFVGMFHGGTIENCYAGGYVDASGTYTENYVNVTGNNRVGGFVGNISTGTVTLRGICYSTASVGGADMANVGLFAGASSYSLPTTATKPTLYAVAKAFKGTVTGGITTYSVDAPRDETDYLSNPKDMGRTTGFTDYHYNRGGETFPYQTNLTEHHGDWIDPVMGAYYDTVGGTTGYYANGGNISGLTELFVGKPGDKQYATDDGYRFLSEKDLDDVVVAINGNGFKLEKAATKVTIGTKEYYVYQVPSATEDALNTMPTDGYYFTVSVNGQLFTANFAFAGEIFDGKDVDHSKPAQKENLTVNNSSVAIRSPRQLANAGIWTSRSEASGAIARGLKYEQLLDINYGEYTGKMPEIYKGNKTSGGDPITYNHVPITLSGSNAGYVGNGYTIRGLLPGYLLDVDGSNTFALNGLFGRVKGGAKVSGVNLINPRVVGYSSNDAVAQLDETGTGHISLPLGGGTRPIANGETTYVLDVGELVDNGTLTAGGSVAAKKAINVSGFTIQFKNSGDSTPVTENTATWEYDGESKYSGKYCIRFGSRSSTETNKNSAYIKFTTSGTATVKVWWVQDKDTSVLNLYKGGVGSSKIKESATIGTVGKAYFTVFDITESGTYYLGDHENNGNKYYRVEVTEPAISGVNKDDPTPSSSTPPIVPDPGPTPPASGDSGVNDTLRGKGILAPIGAHFPIGSSAKVRVGALAGILDSATVTESGAYVDEKNASYMSADDAYDNFIVKNEITGGEDAVGGFAGNITGGTVNECFAAVKVIGVRTAGGFAGKLLDVTTVNDCYVGGHTVDGTFGNTDKNNIMVNISTTDKTKRTFTGGFVGQMSGTTFTGINYTTASVGMEYNTYQSGSNNDTISTIGQFAGDGEPKENTGNLYSIGSIFRKGKSSGYDYFPLGTKAGIKDNKDNDLYPVRNETYLNNGIVAADVTPTAEPGPYDDAYETAMVYPYASGQAVHHGDWTERYGFIYYEVYDADATGAYLADIPDVGDRVGFYAVLKDAMASDGKRIVNTLSTTGHVIDSGYMIITDREVGTLAFGIFSEYGGKQASGKETYLKVSYDNSTTEVIKDAKGKIANYFYVIPFDQINNAPSEDYYEKVTINGQPYMLNPYFACEAVNVGLAKEVDGQYVMDYTTVREKPGLQVEVVTRNSLGEKKPEIQDLDKAIPEADTAPVLIRSPWNLASMARYTRDGNTASRVLPVARTWNFVQMLDVNYKTYKEGRVFDGNPSNKDEDGKSRAGTDDNVGQVAAMLGGEISTTQPDGTVVKTKKPGSYNGLGHTITNLYLASDTDDSKYIGLFGLVTNGSIVHNVDLEDIHVNAWGGNSGGCYVGTVAAQIDDGTVENVTVTNAQMDFHKVVYYNKGYKESGMVKLNAVGGVVGQIMNGTVRNVRVDLLGINFNSGKTEFKYKINKDGDTITSYTKGKGSYTSSLYDRNDKDSKGDPRKPQSDEIKIGGAIGDIDTTLTAGATATVTNVYVVNPEIHANKGNDNIVGGLVGRADGKANNAAYNAADRDKITISNSGVYLTPDKVVKDTTGTITTDNFNTKYGVLADKESANVGGFIGRTDNYVSVDNCFSAIRVEGSGNVGGFAGDIEGSVITNSYSGGHTVNNAYDTGNANVKGLDGANAVGGFAGKIESTDEGSLELHGTIYTTSSVTNSGTGTVGRFQGGESNRNSVKKAVDADGAIVYAVGKAVGGVAAADVLDESAYLRTGGKLPTNKNDSFKTENYDPELDGLKYPYANSTKDSAGDMAHYGDWEEYAADGAFYWELEDDGYHFYTVLYDGETVTPPESDLCTDRHEDGHGITAWGYGVFTGKDGTTITLDSNLKEADASDANANGAKDAIMGRYASAKEVKMIAGAVTKSTSGTATVGSSAGSVFTINPSYAAAITESHDTTTPAMGTTGNTYKIRHIQQLQNIGDSEDKYFDQTHDVAGKNRTDYKPVSLKGGKYEGGSYRILDLNITATGSDAALFSTLKDAEIDHTILYATDGNGTISGTNAAGIAVTLDGSRVCNTVVAGYTITGNTVGGIAAKTAGTTKAVHIENSEATANLVTTRTTTNGGVLGGLVGNVTEGKLEIINSYAGGKASVTGDKPETKLGTENSDKFVFVGGIVGKAPGSGIVIENSNATEEAYKQSEKKEVEEKDKESYTYGKNYYSYQFKDGSVTYDNVYSYLDMYDIKFDRVTSQYRTVSTSEKKDSNGKKYTVYTYKNDSVTYNRDVIFSGIGPNVNDRDENIGYWDGGMPDKNVADRELSMSLHELSKMNEGTGAVKSDETYIPDADVLLALTDRQTLSGADYNYKEFPFRAFVQADGGSNVHYGEWPEAAKYAGVFYYEKENSEYNYYAYGIEFVNGRMRVSEILDTLCKEHHVNEVRGIEETGYGYFVPDDGNITFSISGTNPFTFEPESASGTIGSTLLAEIGFPETTVMLMTDDSTPSDKQGLYVTYKDLEWTMTYNSEKFGLHVIPAFGGAIYGDEFVIGTNDDNHPEQDSPFAARTPEQFMNITKNHRDGSVDYYIISHDIDFSKVTDYTPGPFGGLVLDGQGYRLFNLNITKDGKGYESSDKYKSDFDDNKPTTLGAALFTSDKGNTRTLLKNIIMYAPNNDGVITSKDHSAAGIVVNHIRGKIENCVVAGYTITGKTSVGGITAISNHKDNKIGNCEAVNDLVGSGTDTKIGGIVGEITHNLTYTEKVKDDAGNEVEKAGWCYTGGSVSFTDPTAVTNKAIVGGIYGYCSGGQKDVKNCYTYMTLDESQLGNALVYPIGGGTQGGSSPTENEKIDKSTCFYLEDNYSGSHGDQATKVNYSKLAAKADKERRAQYSYWPKTETGYYGYVSNAMGAFPFRTVAFYTEDGENINVHYGRWPEGTQAAGVAYYEKDSDGNYSFQIVGVHSDGTDYTYDDLCTDYHVDSNGNISMDHQIVESGYAAFTTKPGTMTVGGGCQLTGIGTATTDSDLINNVSLAIGNAIGGAVTEDGIKVYPTGTTGDTDDHSATVTAGGTSPTTVHYTNGFAGVSKNTMGTAADDSFKIRTVRQLDNIPDSETSGKYFKQTHDLYGENYTADGVPIYIGAAKFAGTYNGGSYRILELSMVGNTTDTEKDVGLFRSASGTIENVILYSPKGTATITNNNRNTDPNSKQYSGTGGIVGRSSGNSVKVTNCIVAGYKIYGCDAVGGIVGHAYYGTEVTDCVAVNELFGKPSSVSTYARGIGGIIGAGDLSSQNAGVKVSNCYAGGKITDAGSDTIVGGIFGRDVQDGSKVVVTNSYTYVNLNKNTNATATNIYAIGKNLNLTSSTGNYYLDESVPASCNKNGGEAKDYFDIVEKTTTDSASAAHAYAPSTTDGLKNTTYPFPAKAKDNEGNPVHYGAMPEHKPVAQAINGIFYWEKHGTEYDVQYIGQNEEGNTKNGGKLCEERDGIGIEESGFGYFAMGAASATATPNAGDAIADTATITGITEALKDNGVFGKVNVTAFKAGTKVENTTWTVGPVSAAVNQGFAKVYSDADAPKVSGPAYEIRTIEQLSKINDLGSGSSNEVKNYMFTQTHDLMSNNAVNTAYIPAYLSDGAEYDGQGYRILELSISTANNNYIGLFSRVKVKVQNVVLYSPSGDAKIENGQYSGGIAGELNGGTIENCVVAGYTISGKKFVGGIAGQINSSGTITKSQAVNALVAGSDNSGGVGGIAGNVKGTIENCYAGGKITNAVVSSHQLKTGIGGIFGKDNTAKANNCYSYVDLSNVGSSGITDYNDKLAAIGQNYSGTDCYYLKSNLPPTSTAKVNFAGSELTASTRLGSPFVDDVSANSSYAPAKESMTGGVTGTGKLEPMTDSYPYPAVFTPDGGATHEHYGTWVATTTPGGDPGISEGPSFAPAILPKKFTLPDPDDQEEPGGDDHTEYVTLRTRPATVRRVSK